jgi:hypothetical protein
MANTKAMIHDKNQLRALRDICEGIIRGNFDLSVETSEESLDSWKDWHRPKSFYSIKSQNEQLTFDAIAKIVLILLDDTEALWLLSEKGQAAQKKVMASAMHLGAANPRFTPEAARELTEREFKPFDLVINVLQRNGYEVNNPTAKSA